MTKAKPLKHRWGTLLGWIIWSGRPTLNPSEVRRPTLNGPHFLEEGRLYFRPAALTLPGKLLYPDPFPSLVSEPASSSRSQCGLKTDPSLGPALDSSTRRGLWDSQSHALSFPSGNSQDHSNKCFTNRQMYTHSFYQLCSLETPINTKASVRLKVRVIWATEVPRLTNDLTGC